MNHSRQHDHDGLPSTSVAYSSPMMQNMPLVAVTQSEDELRTNGTAIPNHTPSSPVQINAISRVNGRGMWRSWKRNFKSSLMAVLDLFDNAIDASLVTTEETLHFKGMGKIHVQADKDVGPGTTTGISMINNCHSRIPVMSQVLEIFRSAKGSQDIGENGVGIKQACAALTDISFIITRNGKELSIGVIAAALQRNEGCVLPFISLHSEMERGELSQRVMANKEFEACVRLYGEGILHEGLNRLWNKCEHVCKGVWAQDKFVFCVLLHKLRHGTAATPVDDSDDDEENVAIDYEKSAENLMTKLADALPQRYIHIPADFDVRIDDEKIRFQYWERRLVDLTEFHCKIDRKHDWSTAADFRDPQYGYGLRIFCGFDPHRPHGKLSLYVYSRHSGRLISAEEDARHTLHLQSSGTLYAAGLTVILDDYASNLPLTPTKQGLGFAEETTDGVHEKNLYAWTAAYADAYYKYHYQRFGEAKQALREGVESCLEPIRQLEHQDEVESFTRGTFTVFEGLTFSNYNKKTIRKNSKRITVVRGPDSRVNLTPPANLPPLKKQKRKANTDPSYTPSFGAAAQITPVPTHHLMETRTLPGRESAPVAALPEESSLSSEDLNVKKGPLESFRIPRKRPSTLETQTTSETGQAYEEGLGPRGIKYKDMYEKLHLKFIKSNDKKERYKEKATSLEADLAKHEKMIRKKNEAIEDMEYELNQTREDLALAEEMKNNLKRDIATLERQNAMLDARLKGRRSSNV